MLCEVVFKQYYLEIGFSSVLDSSEERHSLKRKSELGVRQVKRRRLVRRFAMITYDPNDDLDDLCDDIEEEFGVDITFTEF